MSFDLFLDQTPQFNSSGKYGASMSNGQGTSSDLFLGLNAATLEAWLKTTAAGSIQVAAGSAANMWLGMNANGTATGHYGNANDVALSGPVINDGNWHHVAVCASTTAGGSLWVDGVQAASGGNADAMTSKAFGVRVFGGSGGFNWTGEIDEVAVSAGIKYAATFAPGPISNGQANLRAVWHLNGNGTNSAGTAVPTFPGAPTVGIATAGNATGAVAFTPGAAGTNPTTSYLATASTGETATGTSSPIAFGVLSVGVPRTFHVQGVSADGAGLPSGESNSITPTSSTDNVAPSLTGPVTLGVPTSTTVNASWAAGTDNVAVVGYERSIDAGATYVGVGNVQSAAITGLTPNTAYPAVRVRCFDAAGNKSPVIVSTAGFTTAAASPDGFTSNILFSPGNWNVQSVSARTICSGAYFSTLFGGSSCILNFDMTGVSAPYPKLAYRLDRHGPVNVVPLAATVVLSIPSDVAGYQSHLLEVIVDSTSEAVDNWSGGCAVALIGLTLDSGKALTKPAPRTNGNVLFFGDSITRGINTLNASGDATARSSAQQSWALVAADRLGCEAGIVGFGSQGLTTPGSGNVPVFGSTYGNLYSGSARSFAGIDAVVINQGTNDHVSITANATAALNGLIAAIPSGTKIIVLRPFNGDHAAEWIAAIAACSAPARVFYVDTAGWFNSNNASDGLHPYGYEDIFHIAPLAAAAIKPILSAAAALATRTVSYQLEERDSNGNVFNSANLSDLEVTFTEGAVQRFGSTVETTDSSGIVSFSFGSTLSPGQTGKLSVLTADGRHFYGNVAVA